MPHESARGMFYPGLLLIQAVQELSRRVDEFSTELEDCYNRVSGDDDA